MPGQAPHKTHRRLKAHHFRSRLSSEGTGTGALEAIGMQLSRIMCVQGCTALSPCIVVVTWRAPCGTTNVSDPKQAFGPSSLFWSAAEKFAQKIHRKAFYTQHFIYQDAITRG